MSELSTLQSSLQPKLRSMGLKLIVICGLALLMIIPILFVEGLIDERTKRASDVVREISAHVGLAQSRICRGFPPLGPGRVQQRLHSAVVRAFYREGRALRRTSGLNHRTRGGLAWGLVHRSGGPVSVRQSLPQIRPSLLGAGFPFLLCL
jgi:hypothetical protein